MNAAYVTIAGCKDKRHLISFWLDILLSRYGREAVLEYAKHFQGNHVLGIAAMRWWVLFGSGPDQEQEILKNAREIEWFESRRTPYSVECARCNKCNC